ncbi:HET-domain-containing protein [Epithele typhae]|uniref:HET-domain-containing protein n=1 Tax=Epithele typhae TaxID=378194 RepID=UPI0020078CE1|nr:HET-domain-containing protein [Epithele typhae]KAH9915801.1 HET-domain-containing protein [Epithele typhae]
MWLLSTDRAELQFFSSPTAVSGGYAILSHVWEGDKEQTFQDLRTLDLACKALRVNPRDRVSEKIRQTCLLAEQYDYDWVWIDTCCIDKTSSTELSEAINSMFRWYASAEVCFAYLADVPSDCVLDAPDSAFRRSRWHTRGWTLQELIAPLFVTFVSQDWQIIGTKLELATLLNNITGIWTNVLTNQASYSTSGVAARMAWASKRMTTRVEDEAYCLMGIFNVNMPTIYGEGRQAFQRLQQEIMKQSFDSSLFSWGRWAAHWVKWEPMEKQHMYNSFLAPSLTSFFLLAPSPSVFSGSSTLRYSPNATYPLQPYLPWQWKPEHNEPEDGEKRTLGPFGALELPQFQNTNYGMKCRFPTFEVKGITVAMIMADDKRDHYGILLHPTTEHLRDSSRVRYNVGYGFKTDTGISYVRLVKMGNDWYNLSFLGEPVKPEWRDLYIIDSFPEFRKVERLTICYALHTILPAPPIRIPHWLINRLVALGFEPVRAPIIRSTPKDGPRVPLVAQLTFVDVANKEAVRLRFGTCFPPGSSSEGDAGAAAHWATAYPQHAANWNDPMGAVEHDCATDHVRDWPGWAREFVDGPARARVVRLAFTRGKFAPDATLVLHMELAGSVWAGMMARKNVHFRPRAEKDVQAILAEQAAERAVADRRREEKKDGDAGRADGAEGDGLVEAIGGLAV